VVSSRRGGGGFTRGGNLGLRLGSRFVSVGAGVELGGEGTPCVCASPASGSPERLAPASQGDASVPSSRPHHPRSYE
jgi:hypothetical protein